MEGQDFTTCGPCPGAPHRWLWWRKRLHPRGFAPLCSERGLEDALERVMLLYIYIFLENLSPSGIQSALGWNIRRRFCLASNNEHRNTTCPKLPMQKISLVHRFPKVQGTCLASSLYYPYSNGIIKQICWLPRKRGNMWLL